MRRRNDSELVENELRLLLVALRLRERGQQEVHGYELAKELAAVEETNRLMSQATLYRALRRLEERGVLQGRWESADEAHAAGRTGRPRHYYRVTDAGAGAASIALGRERTLAEQRRWRRWNLGELAP